MVNWIYYLGKKVWIVLKNKKHYEGKVIDVDTSSSPPLIWITILDKYNQRIMFVQSEIEVMQEEMIKEEWDKIKKEEEENGKGD